MFFTKLRFTLVALLSTAAVSGLAVSSASAAIALHKPGTIVRPVSTVSATTALQAGSAGIPGYDDAACESLANDFNTAVNAQESALLSGDTAGVNTYGELGQRILTQMTDNCLVVY